MNDLDFHKTILDEIPGIVYLSDIETYQVYYINKMLHADLGFIDEEVWKNTPCYKLLQNLDAPCPFCTNHLLTTDSVHEWHHYNESLQTWYAIKDKKIEINGKNLRLEIAHDATEITNQKEQLNTIAEEESILVACAGLLHSSNVPERALQKLLDLIRIFYNADRSYIFEIDYEKKIISTTKEACKKNVPSLLTNLRSAHLKYFKCILDHFKAENLLYVEDIDKDELFKENIPTYDLAKANHVKSFILVPIMSHDGTINGFFGVDNPLGKLNSKDLLKQVSYFVSDFKEKQKLFNKLNGLSYVDSMSSLHNTHKYIEDVNKYQIALPSSIAIAYVDMNGLKRINDSLGHEAGNELIISLSSVLLDVFEDKVYRTGGDEFIALIPNILKEKFYLKIEELKIKVCKYDNLQIAVGTSWTDEAGYNIKEQIQKADLDMYANKRKFYADQGFDRRQNR